MRFRNNFDFKGITKFLICEVIVSIYKCTSQIIRYFFKQVLEVAAKHTNFKESDDVNITDPENLKRTISILQLPLEKEKHLEQLRLMIERDPLTPLHEQEIEMIWLLRYECQFHYPSSLPKLLNCVQWNNYIDVAQVSYHALI